MYPRTRPFLACLLRALPTLALVGCGGGGDADAVVAGGSSADGGSLGAPTAAFPEDFGAIQSVREMPDGSVLIADPLGGALYSVDLDAATRTQIGTEGQGPGEYRQPDATWALPGDSTLLIDLGNGRMTAMGPDLSFGPTSPLSAGDPRSGLLIAIPQAVDGGGFVYARSMGGGMMMEPPDSGAVLRIARGTLALDTVATFKLEDRTITRSGGPNNQNVSMSPVPLSPEDAWGVAADGSVAVARSIDYHVEWFGPDGNVTSGSPKPFDPVSIGTSEKEEWSRAETQTGGGLSISVMMNNDQMQTNFGRGGQGRDGDDDLDRYDWPETKPPFYGGRLAVDPSNRVWVRRHVEAGEDATYDLFDRSGEFVATYTLGNNKRVIGFGASGVYVVSYDEFDLNYLERYAMPM